MAVIDQAWKEYLEWCPTALQCLKEAKNLLFRIVPCKHSLLTEYLNELDRLSGQLSAVKERIQSLVKGNRIIINRMRYLRYDLDRMQKEIYKKTNALRAILPRIKSIIIETRKNHCLYSIHTSLDSRNLNMIEWILKKWILKKQMGLVNTTMREVNRLKSNLENVDFTTLYEVLHVLQVFHAIFAQNLRFVELVNKAEKTNYQHQQQLHRREAVKEILHEHKQMFHQGFHNSCLKCLETIDSLSERLKMSEYLYNQARDKLNQNLERWNTLKRAIDATAYMLYMSQLPEKWKEQCYESFPTPDSAMAYLVSDIMRKGVSGDVFSRPRDGIPCHEDGSHRYLLALQRLRQESEKEESEVACAKRKLIESNEKNVRLASEMKELRDEHAKVIDKLNIMERHKELNASNALVDSQTQFTSLNEVNSENPTDETIVKTVDVETMTDYSGGAEDTCTIDSGLTTAHCSAEEETLVKEVESHSTSPSQDGPTEKHTEQTRQESLIDSVVSQEHRMEHRNQHIRRQSSTDMAILRPGTQRNVFERSKLVTSSNSIELLRCLLSIFLEEEKSNRIKSHDLHRRTFGVPILVLKLETKPAMDDEFDATGMDTSPIWISSEDAECIISYLKIRGFAFLCREGICFYFSVGNRDTRNVNLEIDNMQEAMRNICFGRFFGRVVDGHKIKSLEDLVISFRTEGSLDPSSWRFYYVLPNNGILTDDRRIGKLLLRKYCCGILLLMLWFMCACIVTKVFRRK